MIHFKLENKMSKETIISNLLRVASNMFTQFSTEEPLISEEAQVMLSNSKGREELYNKIIDNPQPGEVSVTINGKTTRFFVEA